jgi:HPt (histidine-containing phosphotransfer) domain-containing protein
MQGDRERYLAAGMDGYISKPMKAEELLRMTERLATSTGPIDTSGDTPTPVFDRNLALERVDGDASLLADLAQVFLEESPHMLADVQEAVQRKDASAIERAAHSLKGSIATFAAKDAFEVAMKLETIGREGRVEAAEAASASVVSEVGRLRVALEDFATQQQATSKIESQS